MLSVNHVTKKYGKFIALEDITLEFENGVYGLLAPNGAGKTTLMKMLATLLFPTSGEILWDGIKITELGEQYRDILGYLPQKFGYYKNNTPRQFLRYLAALKYIDVKVVEEKIEQLLEMVSLGEDADKKMRKFSGGMLQRVGIAQAMLNDPKVLILDEPTAGLDPKERVRFRNIIHNLAKDRIVILSTHIVSDIETIANQIVMLRQHKLLCCESPKEVCKRLQGKVYEVPAESENKEIGFLLSERQSENGTVLRVACEEPPKDGVLVAPNLEDVFLYIYRDGMEG